jgi:hypothetical protein
MPLLKLFGLETGLFDLVPNCTERLLLVDLCGDDNFVTRDVDQPDETIAGVLMPIIREYEE